MAWEPAHGTGAVVFLPEVGGFIWRRQCSFAPFQDFYSGPRPQVPAEALPAHDYLAESVRADGTTVPTLKLFKGEMGGFEEARPYSVANVFLCNADEASEHLDSLVSRASVLLNNVLGLYGFLTANTVVRPLSIGNDSYYTMASLAAVPERLRESPAPEVLAAIGELTFSSVIGAGRSHKVGLNSLEDLLPGGHMQGPAFAHLCGLVREEHRVELWVHLFQSALRRLKRKEYALAMLDAQSAFEVCVAAVLRDAMQRSGVEAADIEAAFSRSLRLLQPRLRELDRLATLEGAQHTFLGGAAKQAWHDRLYSVRNEIVHGGIREVDFGTAKAGIVAGLQAVDAVTSLTPSFRRDFEWTGQATELPHVHETAGRMSRLFEL